MELVVIYGGGGHGRDIAHDLTEQGHKVMGFYDDDPDRRNHPHTNLPMICGANDPQVREFIVKSNPAVAWLDGGRWVHRRADIGPGVMLGAHTHVNSMCFLTRCTVGAFTTISPGVTVCGDVKIGSGCFIGAGATVKNFVTIGDGAVVGAGSVVVKDVPAGATVKGNPAQWG